MCNKQCTKHNIVCGRHMTFNRLGVCIRACGGVNGAYPSISDMRAYTSTHNCVWCVCSHKANNAKSWCIYYKMTIYPSCYISHQ